MFFSYGLIRSVVGLPCWCRTWEHESRILPASAAAPVGCTTPLRMVPNVPKTLRVKFATLLFYMSLHFFLPCSCCFSLSLSLSLSLPLPIRSLLFLRLGKGRAGHAGSEASATSTWAKSPRCAFKAGLQMGP